jgi:hypothetical protein
MKNHLNYALASLVAALALFAPVANAASDCEAKALSKDSKPLAGATAAPSCANKALDKNDKPLAGAAKNSFMKKCEADDK